MVPEILAIVLTIVPNKVFKDDFNNGTNTEKN